MSAHSDNQGRFERPPTPPSPSSIYTSRVASPVSSIASHERSGEPHDPLTPDNNIDDLFEALLDTLNSGYLHRQSLKQQLQETEDAIVATNWDLFLLEHQSQQPQLPLSTADAPSSPPPRPSRFQLQSPNRTQNQPGNQPSQHSYLTAARDAALSRRQRLWEEIKAATAGVEGQMGLFWRLLRERERFRGSRAAGNGGGDDDVVERVRRLLIPASLDELEGVRAVLDELLPRGLVIGSPRGGRPKKVAPGLQTWI